MSTQGRRSSPGSGTGNRAAPPSIPPRLAWGSLPGEDKAADNAEDKAEPRQPASEAGTAPRARAVAGRKRDRSTRERILDVAADLFIEQGYDLASLREIAERMGFTKAALYYHFASKADILMALHLRLHSLIDGPISLLGDGPVDIAGWEQFLFACIDQMQANQKLFQVHRVNQAALGKLHIEGHEGAHFELEERARKIFSDPTVSADKRLRMAAAFSVAFVTPMMAGGLGGFEGAEETTAATLRHIVSAILHGGPASTAAAPAATRRAARGREPQ